MNTVTKVMTKEEILSLKENLPEAEVRKTPPYAYYQIKTSECTITAYLSGKVVFQGENVSSYVEEKKVRQVFPQCGSDEVGTGDYFGPVVVCACLVEEKDMPLLNTLKIQDSKQLKDSDIIKIAPKVMEQLTYSLLVLDNEKYNKVHETNNMNEIKAKLHNQAYVHLLNKITCTPKQMIIDEFAKEKTYYNYLKNEKNIVRGIHFETKAENKYIAVACASIISRFTFLQAMDQLSAYYDFTFPKGAGTLVDEAGIKFMEHHTIEDLNKVCKLHFKNTEKIL